MFINMPFYISISIFLYFHISVYTSIYIYLYIYISIYIYLYIYVSVSVVGYIAIDSFLSLFSNLFFKNNWENHLFKPFPALFATDFPTLVSLEGIPAWFFSLLSAMQK